MNVAACDGRLEILGLHPPLRAAAAAALFDAAVRLHYKIIKHHLLYIMRLCVARSCLHRERPTLVASPK